MAKKKEEQLSLMQMPLPQGRKHGKFTRMGWKGLNRISAIDSGEMSDCLNVSSELMPYIQPSKTPKIIKTYYYPIDVFSFEDKLYTVYKDSDGYIKINWGVGTNLNYTTLLNKDGEKTEHRSVVLFNVFDSAVNPAAGKFTKRILVFPDKVSMAIDFEEVDDCPVFWNEDKIKEKDKNKTYIHNGVFYRWRTSDLTSVNNRDGFYPFEGNTGLRLKLYLGTDDPPQANEFLNFNCNVICQCGISTSDNVGGRWQIGEFKFYKLSGNSVVEITGNVEGLYYPSEDMEDEVNNVKIPDIEYATVYQSRLYGVGGGMVYVSGFNDYTNWNFDNVVEALSSNAWCSPSQSNVKAGGNFVGITTFQDKVICFKEDFMHEVYGSKNPFKINDIYAEGALNNTVIQEVSGRLIFASSDGVKLYTGSVPTKISDKVKIPVLPNSNVASASDGRYYYLFYGDKVYVLDTENGCWTIRKSVDGFVCGATCLNGVIYFLNRKGLYCLDDSYGNWWFETDFITGKTVDIKRIKKIQLLAEQMEPASGTSLKVYFLPDNDSFKSDDSQLVCEWTSEKVTTKKSLRFKPRMTANYGFKLRIGGSMPAKIYCLEIMYEQGGDLYVSQ